MNKRRRLVFVWNYLSWGGAQVYFLAIMKAACENWDIVVHLPKASPPDIVRYLEQLDVEYTLVEHHLDPSPADGLVEKLNRQLNRIAVEVKTFRDLLKYDVHNTVFQIEIAPWQSITFLTAMSLRGARVFITLHNFLPDASAWRKLVWKYRLRFVSYLPGLNFFTSNVDTKTRLRGLANEKFWDRIKVTFTAVNPPQIDEALNAPFDRAETLITHGIPSNDFVVLSVGNFIDRKGRWIFLEAASRVLRSDSNITFVWLTPQVPSTEDEKRIGDYELGEKFKLVHSAALGTERLDVLTFFRIADVFTLPSYVEGLPISLLEAMALARPSISTSVYAIPEAVQNLETGLLVEAGDAVGLADAILQLKNDPALRAKLSENGRKFVVEHFDERDAAATAIAEYEEALPA
ncbi:MAG: glycosyltransferase family 4 protein [Acidobacteriota bacterium]